MRFKTVTKNINLLNVIMVIILALMIRYIFFPFLDTRVNYSPPPVKKVAVKAEEKLPQAQPVSLAEYTVIADQNLFHPDRKIPAEKKEGPAPSKPDFVLYGTLISDGTAIAYMDDLKSPVTTPGRGRRQTALRRGDTMSGFTLKDVDADKVVMTRGEENLMVYLNDPQKPKNRETMSAGAMMPAQPRYQPQTFPGQMMPSQIGPPPPPMPSAQKPFVPTAQQTIPSYTSNVRQPMAAPAPVQPRPFRHVGSGTFFGNLSR